MAERRMMAKSVIETDVFMDMPMSSQCLYFHLLLRGDDDGFIANPKRVMREVGVNDDDMKMLIAKRYIIPFESGVVVIRHWRIHNYIRSDRYTQTHCDELSMLEIKQNKTYEKRSGIPTGIPGDIPTGIPSGIPSDNHVSTTLDTQVRLGKDSIDKSSVEEDKSSLSGKPDEKAPAYSEMTRKVIDYLNQKAGTTYRATTKKTIEHIKARMKEGATLEDFKVVIDAKCKEWINDEKMSRYLRPDTLFGTKFDWYLNQPKKKRKPHELGEMHFV